MAGSWEPGWRWSEHMQPVAGTDSCEATHLIYAISGTMHVVMNDGSEGDIGPGDFASINPGHDAWVVGDDFRRLRPIREGPPVGARTSARNLLLPPTSAPSRLPHARPGLSQFAGNATARALLGLASQISTCSGSRG